ncbi:DapH/DapD/GlmU-related protein [Pseudomonas quasicaspiana]|uniref:DapH/DapD/GlmU-related protein n=1 Tax=Pseudomonas quasicaspiana TaxID=2829821 RepID=UPI001E62EF5B|nr:transferase [Pseudomonas quasicaspiana]MCD5974193.1 transferase [Pseudomonas quasicaspiana]
MQGISISEFISHWGALGLGANASPWAVTEQCEEFVRRVLVNLGPEYERQGDIAIHKTAQVEDGAVLKGAIVIGPNCFIAAGAYLRGGVFLGSDCIVGPSCELKSSFMLDRSKLAHFNFVGDSLLGQDVNIEAGAVIANYRNEFAGADIRILHGDRIIETGVAKFGALVGDGTRIGANAVVAPGALLERGSVVPRLGLVDQYPGAS